ncbi:MAG: LysR family transcriptional regulator [Alphaproteobacteria bacterium]|jgi:DNA-binding transcriptional LysR family regulator|nr:LysR family transcriptional regulator [Alphaproteobacteria bacterium]MBT5389216.1 LysR family transcriptional regulator [Alphaproteobacteria bacterium]MBT5653904.1 LysR family transcriptional regulator [Alphaproteobacteria bacterium]
MDLEKVKVFYRVAQEGGITRAAEKLNIAQSAVSRTISLLEEDLGTCLFSRHQRGVELSESGRILFSSAQNIVSLADLARTEIDDIKFEARGKLSVVTTSGCANIWLQQYLPGFYKKYKNMRVKIIGCDTDIEIEKRSADVAIRPFLPHRHDLIQQYLKTCHLKVVASKEYLSKFGTPKTFEELNEHRIVCLPQEVMLPFGNVNWLLTLGAKPGKARVPYFEVNSSVGLIAAAENNMGVVAMDRDFLKLKGSHLVEVFPEHEGQKVNLYYIYPSQLKNSKRITSLGEYLVEQLKKEPSYDPSQEIEPGEVPKEFRAKISA